MDCYIVRTEEHIPATGETIIAFTEFCDPRHDDVKDALNFFHAQKAAGLLVELYKCEWIK